MKLELRVGDKELIEPDFKIYTVKNSNNIIIVAMAVPSDSENNIKEALKNDEFNIEMENGIIGLSVDDMIYSFDIGYFLKDKFSKREGYNFSIAFAFLDSDDKIKREDLKAMEMVNN
ncbi:hypothetical protein [Citrobacter koseri]|uniref:hypothetical protein n=1 Tax=Citrobacter koseri TaxID=545 RepID=UPI0038912DDE